MSIQRNNNYMEGKNGYLIMSLREGESITLDGPGMIKVKGSNHKKVVVLIDADKNTKVIRKSKEETQGHLGAKD